MSRRTSYFKIDRKLLNHDIWLSERFSKGQAWVDLIGMADYADRQITQRGELWTSTHALAKRWHWDRQTVKRFLDYLAYEGMARVEQNKSGTKIFLTHYNDYQGATTNATTNATTFATTAKRLEDVEKSIYQPVENSKDATTHTTMFCAADATQDNKYNNINIKSLSIARAEIQSMASEFGEARLQTLIDELVDWKLNHPGVIIHNDAAKIRQFARDQQRWQEERNRRSVPSKRKSVDDLIAEIEAETRTS